MGTLTGDLLAVLPYSAAISMSTLFPYASKEVLDNIENALKEMRLAMW